MRAYAPFFEWFDKGRKELGVVEELIISLNSGGQREFWGPQLFRPDPPDCICFNSAGERVAIEVVEAVCERAARLNAQGQLVFRMWRSGEFRSHIAALLDEKDQKTYHGGPHAEIITCVFTDEPAVTSDYVAAELQHVFGPFKQLTGGFVLRSYDPGAQSYPVLPLKVADDA